MTDGRVAMRYAKALFSAAQKTGSVGSVGDDLELYGTLLSDHQGLKTFMESPNVSTIDRKQMVKQVFADRLDPLTVGFLDLMLSKRRETLFQQIRLEYAELRRRHEGIIHVRVVSAMPLHDDQKLSLLSKLEKQLGRKAHAEYEIEADLIGGIRVHFDDYVLDGSIRGSLKRMRDQILYDLLHQA